ncbi:MAG: histidine phosphatase family protein [Campylobacterota bacterium]|nr:histidine phosphatase family protein [Campylobacterota bacterium]
MKQLYIIRHAKSSWKNLSLDDFDRGLNKRGALNAPFMGLKLKEAGVLPDIIISSPALRAKITAKVIAKKTKYKKDIIFDKNIYESTVNNLHKIVTSIDDKNNIAFLFGHNPTLNMLVEDYIDFYDNIPTCGIVKIEFNCNSWKEINGSNASFISFDCPKRYKE